MCDVIAGGGYELVSTEEWEEEQKRLDRQWYSMDEGYDESHNPFSGLSDEYTKRKEQELEQKRKKKISARQRQIHKVCCYLSRCKDCICDKWILPRRHTFGLRFLSSKN